MLPEWGFFEFIGLFVMKTIFQKTALSLIVSVECAKPKEPVNQWHNKILQEANNQGNEKLWGVHDGSDKGVIYHWPESDAR